MKRKLLVALLVALLVCVGTACADDDNWLDLSGKGLTSLNVSGYPALSILWCENNQLTTLDVSHNPALTILKCNKNLLTTLDVSHNPALLSLLCYNNQLTTLDFSHNPALVRLDCYDNQLATLDVSHNPALKYLECTNNQLTTLDVSHNPALISLWCGNNQLTTLDVSHNPDLQILDCSSNQLTSLDVSHNPALIDLYCEGNQLTCLDLTNNSALESFDCRWCGRKVPVTADRTFDLSTLEGFDVSRASNWQGGTVDGATLTFDTWKVTYTYDCGNGFKKVFYLEPVLQEITLYSGGLDANNKPAGDEVTQLKQTFGSFTWDGPEDDNFSLLTMEIKLTYGGEMPLNGVLYAKLPEGFSFYSDVLVNVAPVEYQLEEGGSKSYYFPVHPLYRDGYEASADFGLYEDMALESEITTKEIPVSFNAHSGKILMRPTRKVTKLKPDQSLDEWLDDSFRPADFITADTTVYSNDMAMLGCTLSQAVYDLDGHEVENDTNNYLETSLHNLGFSDVVFHQNRDPYGAAVGFARKKVMVDKQVYNVGMVIVRGTVDSEWVGNFDVIGDDTTVHDNFHSCYIDVRAKFENYLDKLQRIEDTLKKQDESESDFSFDRIYVCGHSRGGAIANLFAHYLNDYYGVDSVMCYTFAAPNCTRQPVKDGNIFNYCYEYDLVPFVPQRYGKHGVTLVVGGIDAWLMAPVAVEYAFETYTNGNEYKSTPVGLPSLRDIIVYNMGLFNRRITKLNEIVGNIIADPESVQDNFIARAHGSENYCAWVRANGINGAISMDACIARILDPKYALKRLKEDPGSAKDVGLGVLVAAVLGPVVDRVHETPCESDTALWILLHKDAEKLKDHKFFAEFSLMWKSKRLISVEVEGKKITHIIKCPVNINVLNASNQVIAQVEEHNVRYSSDAIEVFGTGAMTFVSIPYGMGYRIEVTGTKDGEINVSTFTADDFSNFDDVYQLEAIPVKAGDAFYTESAVAGDGLAMSLLSSNGHVYSAFGASEIGVLQIPDQTVSIEPESFMGIAAEMVIVPQSCETIGSRAFADCPNLKYVVFENPETQYAEDAFADDRVDLTFIGK